MIRTIALIIVVMFGPLASAHAADPPKRESREHYAILAEQNIFMRNRAPRTRPTRETERPAPPAPPIEARFVLTGIVEEGDSFRAHIEDRSGPQQLVVSPGQPIADGKLIEINLDGVLYQAHDTQTRVAIGQDLRGQTSAIAATPPATPAVSSSDNPGTTTTSTEAAVQPNNSTLPANLSLEERMRLRRLQEIKPE